MDFDCLNFWRPEVGAGRDVIVFLGPSLPQREAARLLEADYWPPARQGDIFRALAQDPRVLVLIDGVFESAPSVWHHELLAAHSAGVHLFGASSMGALRAAELPGVVRGVGEIAARYRRGLWNDDSLVALLHSDASHGFRALTVPWVNVWATARAAAQAGVLSVRERRTLESAAASVFYQVRTWGEVLTATGWSPERCAAFRVFLRRGEVDLKADDARKCLTAAAQAGSRKRAKAFYASSFVRRSRLLAAAPHVVARLGAQKDKTELEEAGLRRLLLAEFARIAGLRPSPKAVERHRKLLSGERHMARDEQATMAELLALDEMVLSSPQHFVPDGPSRLEGLVFSARLKSAFLRQKQRPAGLIR